MRGKKGFELALNTIIFIVLGMMVLIALMYMLNVQTGFLSSFIKSSGKSNVDVVVETCNSLANNQQAYSYCCESREMVLKDKTKINGTCGELGDKFTMQSFDCSQTSCE